MFKGFYMAGSGMIAQQRRTEVLANNLSNARTPGFKEDRTSIRSFPEMYLSHIDKATIPTQSPFTLKGVRPVGAVGTGVYMQETVPNFTQGSLLSTDLPTDVALVDIWSPTHPETGERGMYFFTIEGPAGEQQYTRNGSFALGPDDFLTTQTGQYVLDSNGERIQLLNDDFSISPEGIVSETGQRIGVAFSDRPKELVKRQEGIYVHPNGEALPEVAQEDMAMYFEMKQGYLEGSNVDAGRVMTDMMTAYRAFEANSKVLQAYDRSMEKAVELGRLT
ncbi:MAG TPA: flagellar hook-basal body protein [Savagea sp.]